MDEVQALHYSKGKLGIDQIPVDVLAELGLVYSYGEVKYARNNWKKGTDWSQFVGSLKRHLMAWELGEDVDPESGCLHLAHVLWNAATLIYYDKHELGVDDRDYRLGGMTSVMTDFRDALADVQKNAEVFRDAHV